MVMIVALLREVLRPERKVHVRLGQVYADFAADISHPHIVENSAHGAARDLDTCGCLDGGVHDLGSHWLGALIPRCDKFSYGDEDAFVMRGRPTWRL